MKDFFGQITERLTMPQIVPVENQAWSKTMAIYISIKQTANEIDFVEYSFGNNENQLGKLRISKDSGEISLVESYSTDNEQGIYQRAAHKIKKHWESGELPKETCWAS